DLAGGERRPRPRDVHPPAHPGRPLRPRGPGRTRLPRITLRPRLALRPRFALRPRRACRARLPLRTRDARLPPLPAVSPGARRAGLAPVSPGPRFAPLSPFAMLPLSSRLAPLAARARLSRSPSLAGGAAGARRPGRPRRPPRSLGPGIALRARGAGVSPPSPLPLGAGTSGLAPRPLRTRLARGTPRADGVEGDPRVVCPETPGGGARDPDPVHGPGAGHHAEVDPRVRDLLQGNGGAGGVLCGGRPGDARQEGEGDPADDVSVDGAHGFAATAECVVQRRRGMASPRMRGSEPVGSPPVAACIHLAS